MPSIDLSERTKLTRRNQNRQKSVEKLFLGPRAKPKLAVKVKGRLIVFRKSLLFTFNPKKMSNFSTQQYCHIEFGNM